jgi:hypothetical protein
MFNDIDWVALGELVWTEITFINTVLIGAILLLLRQLLTPAPSITAADLPTQVSGADGIPTV